MSDADLRAHERAGLHDPLKALRAGRATCRALGAHGLEILASSDHPAVAGIPRAFCVVNPRGFGDPVCLDAEEGLVPTLERLNRAHSTLTKLDLAADAVGGEEACKACGGTTGWLRPEPACPSCTARVRLTGPCGRCGERCEATFPMAVFVKPRPGMTLLRSMLRVGPAGGWESFASSNTGQGTLARHAPPPPCSCGAHDALWRGDTMRIYSCDRCHAQEGP